MYKIEELKEYRGYYIDTNGKAPNTISYKLHNEKDEKYKKYIITFPNQSTIESIN